MAEPYLKIEEQLDMRFTIDNMRPELREQFYGVIGSALEMAQTMNREERRVAGILIKEAIKTGTGAY